MDHIQIFLTVIAALLILNFQQVVNKKHMSVMAFLVATVDMSLAMVIAVALFLSLTTIPMKH